MNQSCAILIPVYNNEATISTVLEQVRTHIMTVIVVDDGSTDNTPNFLNQHTDIIHITHGENRGKGAALRTGFEYAYDAGFSHVITVDADGEHFSDEIPRFLQRLKEDPEALWIGARTLPTEQKQAFREKMHRSFSNSWIKFFTGVKLRDTMSGFRLYPLYPLEPLTLKSNRFDYEQEVLLEASWVGVPLKEFPVQEIESPIDDAISHFHPVKDLLRIHRVHIRAMLRHMNPFSSLKVEGATGWEKVKNLVKHELTSHTTPLKGSLALALGVFMGIFPIHGFQVVALMFLATKFKLNRPIAYLGVNISCPPLLPFLIISAVKLGNLFMPGSIDTSNFDENMFKKGGAGFLTFVFGSVILAPIAAVLAFLLVYPIFLGINRNSK